jgi:hypothetical protein
MEYKWRKSSDTKKKNPVTSKGIPNKRQLCPSSQLSEQILNQDTKVRTIPPLMASVISLKIHVLNVVDKR